MSSSLDQTGLLTRSAAEIIGILEALRARGSLLTAFMPEGDFRSLIRRIDAAGRRLIIERSPLPAANAAVLARSRCAFHADLPEWHVEFPAAAAECVDGADAAIALTLPEVLARHRPRAHPRTSVPPELPLRIVADAAGVASFDAAIVDISAGGVGFLVYPAEITLEPGTLLRGCRIDLPGGQALAVDLEVRYSHPVVAADGRRAQRSGCRLIEPSEQVLALVRRCLGPSPA